MARSQLTETINRVAGMVTYVRENLNPGEYDLFLDMVAPQPEPEPAAKKTRKKRAARSTSVDGMARAIRGTLERAAAKPHSNGALCVAQVPGLDVPCANLEDNGIHDPNGGYGGYHPFEPPAQPAAKRSSRKAAAASSGANSEIEKGAAISAGAD